MAPDEARAIPANRGAANASRQNPAAAGPVPVRRTRTPEKPITQAPNTSMVTACHRPGAETAAASVKPQLRAQGLGTHPPRPQFAQSLGVVALGVSLSVGVGQQSMVSIGWGRKAQ